ncbi:MAG: CBS domain-containing protein [Herminiimonas sp.]|nr:CBS domain-containing protein [Herminiimonas sp.]
MQVTEVMTRDVLIVNPDQSIGEAAKLMADNDCGSLPVGENDRLVGMITDRDIVVRGLAKGKDGTAKVRDVMSEEVKYCYEEDDVDEVARNMGELQVRRLPVINKDKRLVGIVALGDIANTDDTQSVGEALSAISEPTSQNGAAH